MKKTLGLELLGWFCLRSVKFIFFQHNLSDCLECMLGVKLFNFSLVGLPGLRHLVSFFYGPERIVESWIRDFVSFTGLYGKETEGDPDLAKQKYQFALAMIWPKD